MATAARSNSIMERKIISISKKRQVTIPQKYFEALGFHSEAECILKDGGIFIRPIHIEENEFSEQILEDLIKENYSGDELLNEFKKRKSKVKLAVEQLIMEADELSVNGHSISMEQLFDGEEE